MSDGGRSVHLWRRWRVQLGVGAIMVGLACGSAIYASLNPLGRTPDETAHIDYGYQVWHGHLPVFEDGIELTPGPGVHVPGMQWEAHHPPLYYLLIAPAVGPLLDDGRWNAAVMAARGINVVIAAAGVLALAWAGSLLTTRRRWAWAIAVPAVVAPLTPFLHVGGAAFNDNLAALWVVLCLGFGIVLLRRGPTRSRLVVLALLCGLGSLTRANFVITLIVVTAMVGTAVWLHGEGRTIRRLVRSGLAAAIPFAAAVAASGWFYWRNAKLYDSWAGAHTEFGVENMQRKRRALVDVISDQQFWTDQLKLLEHRAPGGADWLGPWVLVIVGAVGVVALVVGAVRSTRRRPPMPGDPAGTAATDSPSPRVVQTAIVIALLAQLAGVVLLQLVYAGIGGATLNRYVLPGILPIGAVFAAAVLAAGPRLAGAALLVYTGFTWGVFGQWVWIVSSAGGIHLAGTTRNGMPWLAVWAMVVLLVLALAAQAVALTDWSRREPDAALTNDVVAAHRPPTAPEAATFSG